MILFFARKHGRTGIWGFATEGRLLVGYSDTLIPYENDRSQSQLPQGSGIHKFRERTVGAVAVPLTNLLSFER